MQSVAVNFNTIRIVKALKGGVVLFGMLLVATSALLADVTRHHGRI